MLSAYLNSFKMLHPKISVCAHRIETYFHLMGSDTLGRWVRMLDVRYRGLKAGDLSIG